LRSVLGATFVVVSHELSSLFRIADSVLFLDALTQGVIADALPQKLLNDPQVDPKVQQFLSARK
jgi:phospholipid/cholesterol/gamma-HCH transport system ATP-binding protein